MTVSAKQGNEDERQTVPLPTLQTEYPGVVFVKGDTTTKQIALTFDDGLIRDLQVKFLISLQPMMYQQLFLC